MHLKRPRDDTHVHSHEIHHIITACITLKRYTSYAVVRQTGKGQCTAVSPYRVSRFVNAEMEDEIVPVILLWRLVLQCAEKKKKSMPQFSRSLGRASSLVHHGGVSSLSNCTSQKLPVERRQGESQAWAVTCCVAQCVPSRDTLGGQDARGALLPAPTKRRSMGKDTLIASQ